ncbi:MAG: biotin transporter BioY [Oscillospiraceae bacterium]|nr:biotin transporter BioY [Oscillospiraceae bacterium]
MEQTVKNHSEFKAIDMAYIGIGAALIAICSWISIPTTVPFTLQTFAIFLLLGLLGGKKGTLSVLVYILLGAIGLPVFANFSSGMGVLLGNTGGYIIGFLFSGLIYWAITAKSSALWLQIIAFALSLAVCYTFGTAWFMYVYAKSNDPVGLATVLSWCVFPFILPDCVKIALAVLLEKRLRPLLHLQ